MVVLVNRWLVVLLVGGAGLVVGSPHGVSVPELREPALAVAIDDDGNLTVTEWLDGGDSLVIGRSTWHRRTRHFPGLLDGFDAYSGEPNALDVECDPGVPWMRLATVLNVIFRRVEFTEVRFHRHDGSIARWPLRFALPDNQQLGRVRRPVVTGSPDTRVELQRGGATRVVVRHEGTRVLSMPLTNSPDALPGDDPLAALAGICRSTVGPVQLRVDDYVPVGDAASVIGFLFEIEPSDAELDLRR